jgi:hypothetical protein
MATRRAEERPARIRDAGAMAAATTTRLASITDARLSVRVSRAFAKYFRSEDYENATWTTNLTIV